MTDQPESGWVAVMWLAFGVGGLLAALVPPLLVFVVGFSLALICKRAGS